MEVNRPNCQFHRRSGKTDTTDAQTAARADLNGQASGLPKVVTDQWKRSRCCLWLGTRRSRPPQAINQFHALVITAPDHVKQHPSSPFPQSPREDLCRFSAGYRQHRNPTRLTSPRNVGPPLPDPHRRNRRAQTRRSPVTAHRPSSS